MRRSSQPNATSVVSRKATGGSQRLKPLLGILYDCGFPIHLYSRPTATLDVLFIPNCRSRVLSGIVPIPIRITSSLGQLHRRQQWRASRTRCQKVVLEVVTTVQCNFCEGLRVGCKRKIRTASSTDRACSTVCLGRAFVGEGERLKVGVLD